MNALELAAHLDARLNTAEFSAKDISLNGLQVAASKKPVKKAAFAVDACMESIRRAAAAGADVLVVHHGLFWGAPLAITGAHYGRVKALLDADMALYAAHIPLDAHPELGHNACIARAIGLDPSSIKPFGEWRGMVIGRMGCFAQEETLDSVLAKLFTNGEKPAHLLPFGPKSMRTAGVVSGGGGGDLAQAIDAGLDLFITGEIGHEQYHEALEAGISVIAGGHYQTEVFGLKALAKELSQQTGIEAFFVDVPTGL